MDPTDTFMPREPGVTVDLTNSDDDIPLAKLIKRTPPPKRQAGPTSLRGVEKKPKTIRHRTQRRVKNKAGKKINKTPVEIPAGCLVADVLWNKAQGTTFADYMRLLREKGAEDISATTFYFQHPNPQVCNGMTEIVADASQEDSLGAFPEEFAEAVKAVEDASEWSISSIDTFCGGLQPGTLEKGMQKVNDIVVDVNLDGESTVIVPYDETRFGALYKSAGARIQQ